MVEAVVFPILVSATIGKVVAARAGLAADFRTMAMIEVLLTTKDTLPKKFK